MVVGYLGARSDRFHEHSHACSLRCAGHQLAKAKPITNHYSINGELIGEKVEPVTRTDYLPDALGSVTATFNQSVEVVYTYSFKVGRAI